MKALLLAALAFPLYSTAIQAAAEDAGAFDEDAGAFDQAVRPLLTQSCRGCHNEKLASGNLNVATFLDPASVAGKREGWERILDKLRAGEMPPPGVPKPAPEKVAALTAYLEGEFEKVDRNTTPDPGRIVAHRLNRTEYSNTVRDLLGVPFHAEEEFPADDASFGFDNIGAALTVSPTLMQKYLQAAEQIASRAVGGDPLPKPGLFNKKSRTKRLDADTIEFKDRVDFDADYTFRALLVGHRGADDKPLTLVLSIDGKPLKTVEVPVQINAVNKQGGATQRSSQEIRTFIPQGEHTFRAAFINDEQLKDIPVAARLNNNKNIYPESLEIAGPFPPSAEHPIQKKILICDLSTGRSCADRILTNLAHRAYRRPTARPEVAQLMAVYDKAKSGGYTPEQSLQFAITAMLVSPKFLYRIESDPKSGAASRISDLELASRLSYFLWSSTPDDELLRLGESSKLHQPEILDAQVKRMIEDPKSAAFAENFPGQWLEIRSLDAVHPDAKKFPEWTPDLKEAMRTETSMFFASVLRDNRPISDLIDGKYTFLNETLAKYYGIEGVTGPEFRRVDLNTDQRSGVLTQASILTVTSYPNRTSVVLRGKYLLENVFGAPPPPPPPDVPKLDEDTVGVAKSLRQQMEQHRSDPVCASCHSKMDVLGFGMENYDAIGRWRTTDGKFPIDSTGSFPNGKSFAGPAEMKALLHDNMPEFTRTIATKVLTYALGRGIEPFDRRTVKEIVKQTAEQDYSFQALILAVTHSPAFQQRRTEEIARR
jgi:mono/diheme cytochrome c family protein